MRECSIVLNTTHVRYTVLVLQSQPQPQSQQQQWLSGARMGAGLPFACRRRRSSAARAGKRWGCRGEIPRTPPAAGAGKQSGCFARTCARPHRPVRQKRAASLRGSRGETPGAPLLFLWAGNIRWRPPCGRRSSSPKSTASNKPREAAPRAAPPPETLLDLPVEELRDIDTSCPIPPPPVTTSKAPAWSYPSIER